MVCVLDEDGIDMQTSCIPSELERKQSVVHEDVAVSQEVKHVSTCEQKVTLCDEELSNIAAGQDRVIAVFPPPPAVGKIQILKMDLETLEDGKEVNDSVVDLFLMYAASKLDEELFNKCHIFSSFFFSKLSQRVKIGGVSVLPCPEDRHVSAARFTRNVDIFQKMFLFIPVCRSGHWFLALIY
ncbi:sentrin-specific protease 6-like [Porites lutea]|uniref:sentrin-specific protease 6-like n=1 Tax=Porites lutea TaxID=51062 RepID=UPI003CC66987